MLDFITYLFNYLKFETGGFFFIFLCMNILDWFIEIIVEKKLNKRDSSSTDTRIIKNLGNWAIIFIAFSLSYSFTKLGEMTNIDLNITNFLGLLVLMSITINEIINILNKLIQYNVNIPRILILGIEIWNKKIEKINKQIDDKK